MFYVQVSVELLFDEWYNAIHIVMSIRTFRFLLSFSFVLLSLFYFYPYTFAQDSAGISLTPTTIEEMANPGDVLDRILTVTNEGLEVKEYFIYTRDIKGVETGGVPVFAEENAEKTGYEMTEWVTLPFDRITVNPNQTIEIPITISVPPDATPGSHFGGIFVSAQAPRLRVTGAGVGYEVATILSIRISGQVIDTARIRSFSSEKLIYGSKQVNFSAKIENLGNILIRPRGPATITSALTGTSEILLVNDSLAGVFPGSSRTFDFAWNSEGLGFGKYEVVLALGYDGDGGQKTIDASVFFWVFPFNIMLGVLLGFLGIFGFGYMLTRYYIQQAIMRAAGGRRIVPQRYRKQVGVSRFAFVFVSILTVLVVFLIITLMIFA